MGGLGDLKVKDHHERHAVILKYSLESKKNIWTWVGEIIHDPNPNKPPLLEIEEHIFLIRN